MMGNAGTRKAAALSAALLLLGLVGCGDDGGAATTVEESPGGARSEAADEAGQGKAAVPPVPTGLDGEPLPDDWPAEFLVPNGTVVLVLETGGGYSVLIEGVDDEQARSLIDEMVADGLSTTSGVTDLGGGEWVAEVVGGSQRAAYAYAGGGAGEPNVTITLVPNP